MNVLPQLIRREIEDTVSTRGLAVVVQALAAAVHWTDPTAEKILRVTVKLLRLNVPTKGHAE
ncbi:MAG: hypothetical protein IMZ66_02730 [Planctomycetes bacterium]|nr:hypothetical protein [Planctomycetota bacterium]